MKQDLWKVLGIEPTGDRRAIKKAYAEKVRLFHPEEHPEEFQLLRRAYEAALDYAAGKSYPEQTEAEIDIRGGEGKAPVRDREGKSSARDREGKSPVWDRGEKSPVQDGEGKSPVRDREGKSPIRDREGKAPIWDREGKPSAQDREEKSPVRDWEEEPPGAGQEAGQSREQAEDPLFEAVKRAQPREPEESREEPAPCLWDEEKPSEAGQEAAQPREQAEAPLFEAVKRAQPREQQESREAPAPCLWDEELIARGLSKEEKESGDEKEGCGQLLSWIIQLCEADDQSPQMMANWDSLAGDQLFRSYGNSPELLEMLGEWIERKPEPLTITAMAGLYRSYGLIGRSQEELSVKFTADRCFYLLGRELKQLTEDKKNWRLLNSCIIWPRTKAKPSFWSIRRPAGLILRLLLLLILLAKLFGIF